MSANFRFSYRTDGHACVSTFTSATSILQYFSPKLNAINSWTSTDIILSSTIIVSDSAYTVRGDGIPIMWQSSDLKLFAEAAASTSISISTSATSNTYLSTISTTAQIPTQTNATTQPFPSSTPALSTGTIIAIALLIPLFVIASAAATVIYFIMKRKRARINTGSRPAEHAGSRDQMTIMDDTMQSPERTNIFTNRIRGELPSEWPIVELGGRGAGNKTGGQGGSDLLELAA
ncbi:hypothetical protein ACMFMG_012078 [Clarireedia jacksonii]